MKKRKAFLAKVLAAAIAVTAVLPSAITADAAVIRTETTTNNAETAGAWSTAMEKKNEGGEAYWHLVSSTQNANGNNDYNADNAAAVIVNRAEDLTFVEGEDAKVASMDIYPNGTASRMRFGIMLKYVDTTHWAYLNYDVGKWILEYNLGSRNQYPAIPEFASTTLADNQKTTVTITYTSAGQVDIAYTPEGGETTTASLTDASYNNAFSSLETYAATAGEDGGKAPILFGFKAGTYQGTLTDVNLKNMKLNDKDLMTNREDWQWVKEFDGLVFEGNSFIGGNDYVSLDATAADVTTTETSVEDFENGAVSVVVRPVTDTAKFAVAARYTEAGAAAVGFDGSKWYYTVGANKIQVDNVAAPAKDSDYTVNMSIEDGKFSATVTPAGEGAEAIALANDVDVQAVAAGSIALSAGAGTELWVRNLTYTKVVKSTPEELQAAYDAAKSEIGETNTDNKYYSDKWDAYKAALDDAKAMLDSEDEVTPEAANEKKTALDRAKTGLALVDKAALEAKYNELKAEKQELATDDSWKAFQDKLNAAKAVLDKVDKKESIASTEVSEALTTLNNAKKALVERAANAEEKEALKTEYKFAEVSAMENKGYTDKTWNNFAKALTTAKNLLESATSTNTEIRKALDALEKAKNALAEKTASPQEKQELSDYFDSVKGTVNDNYSAESWNAFTAALKNVEDILAKGAAATQYEVQEAKKALEAAKAGLKVGAVFEKAEYAVEATAKVETKLTANVAATYKSSDASVATVDAKGVVTGVKAGKATITATIGGASVTTTVTVTTPKIVLTAKTAKLQIKKSTKAIQVEEKLDSDSVVSWKSSNTKVATVTKAGKVKAKKVGKTTLTVTMKSGATASCKLTVQKGKVVTKSIKVKSAKVTLNAGETYAIGAKRNPITATEKMTYTASKKKVATVSKKGVVTAKSKGTCKITVKCKGKKKVVTVTVK